MKLSVIILLISASATAQSLQLHYDMRGTTDPGRNTKNFPTIYFEYWKATDSSSVLFKIQADLRDEKSNIGKFYMQATKTFRIYKSVQAHLSYSGGLGLTTPREYSYTITNTFAAGISYPFQLKGAFFSAVLDCKFIPYKKSSFDPIFTLYWWKGFYHYKVEFSGDFSLWTENKDHGDAFTSSQNGKRFSFFAEPQVWINLKRKLAIGSKINLYYHVLINDNAVQIYPSIGLRCKL
jgi:Domain of unknown function (DUF5020)